jgi:hypothetical protein
MKISILTSSLILFQICKSSTLTNKQIKDAMKSNDRITLQNYLRMLKDFKDRPQDWVIEGINDRGTMNATTLMHISRLNGQLYTDMLSQLLISGADPDLQDENGETALMHAVIMQNYEGAKLLVNPSDTTLQDKNRNYNGKFYSYFLYSSNESR